MYAESVIPQSYTGKELFRIFLDNKIKPIVLIAFTNHALDHMLNSILDAKITEKIVRLGSQSTDERIAKYNLRNLVKAFDDTFTKGQIGRAYAIKRNTEEEMYRVMKDIQIPEPSEYQIKQYLQTNWGDHLSVMYGPPPWVVEYAARLWESEAEGDEWFVQGKKGKGKEQSHLMGNTYYGLWKRGLDIAFIQPPQPHFITFEPPKGRGKQGGQNVQPGVVPVSPAQQEQKEYQERMLEFFYDLGFSDLVPPVPTGNRPFVQLQDSPAVWEMSLDERKRLAEHWEEEMRRLAYHNYLGRYERLRKRYEDACETYEAIIDEVRVSSILECYPLTFPAEESSRVERC